MGTNREIVPTVGRLERQGWSVLAWPGWALAMGGPVSVRFGGPTRLPLWVTRQAPKVALRAANDPFAVLGAMTLSTLEAWADVASDWPSVFQAGDRSWDVRILRHGLKAARECAPLGRATPVACGVITLPLPGEWVWSRALVFETGTWRVASLPLLVDDQLSRTHDPLPFGDEQ